MKSKRCFIDWVLYFIVGYIIFTLLYLMTQMITLNILGFKGNITEIYINSLSINFIFYIILYIVLAVLNLIYNMAMTKRLNEKLNKLKERSEEHEK